MRDKRARIEVRADMEISIKFPDAGDVIAEEAERFRRLSVAEQAREFGEVIEVGFRQMHDNPQRAAIESQILEAELEWQEAQRRLFKHYGV